MTSKEKTNAPPLKTRQRLLLAASRIFGEKGYQDATIAEISELAEANIAAVNYHFRDKENLYLEAWRHAIQQDLARHPSDGGVNANTSAETRFAGRIRSLIARIADPESHFFAIVNHELAQQTPLLEQIMAQEINPERQALNAIIGELLGAKATEQQIKFCHASVIGQCFHLLKVKQLKLNQETQAYVLDMKDAEAYAEHVIRFALAGIKSIREANAAS